VKTVAVLSQAILDNWFKDQDVALVRDASCAYDAPVPLRAGVCGYLAFLPALLAKVDGMVLTTSCDQMRRAAEWLNDDARVFLFNFPSTLHQERLLEAEKVRLVKWLKGLHERLGEKNDCATQLRSGHDRAWPSTLNPDPFTCTAGGCASTSDARTSGHQDASIKDGKETLSVGVFGGHFCGDQQSVVQFFQKRGVHIALWGCESGERVGDVFQRPNTLFYEQVQAVIAERHLDGILVVRTTWCDVWRLAAVRLHEVVKVPVMEWVMDSQYQGQSFPDGSSTTRLEAFCELLRARRQEGT
jgi:hypothetical protein